MKILANKDRKLNRGIGMGDLAIAVIILTILVGVIGNIFYQAAYQAASIKITANITSYTINIVEWIDRISYDEVNTTLNDTVKTYFKMPDAYDATINVTKYTDTNSTKKDIIKTVTVTVSYTFKGKQESFTVKKLKIKEL